MAAYKTHKAVGQNAILLSTSNKMGNKAMKCCATNNDPAGRIEIILSELLVHLYVKEIRTQNSSTTLNYYIKYLTYVCRQKLDSYQHLKYYLGRDIICLPARSINNIMLFYNALSIQRYIDDRSAFEFNTCQYAEQSLCVAPIDFDLWLCHTLTM